MTHTKETLLRDLGRLGIRRDGVLMVHSSMKAIGPVEGRADAVLDALMEFMKEGLLLLPTHTWEEIGSRQPVYDPASSPSCVGILPELFRKRPGVLRSLHPTHSVGAYGAGAAAYIAGEELTRSPGPRNGCWGRLYDSRAQILFLGCSLKRNTFLHSVEEWVSIPDRLTAQAKPLFIRMPDGSLLPCPQHRHQSSAGDVSARYDKMEPLFARRGAVSYGSVGDARCILGEAAAMAEATLDALEKDPQFFAHDRPWVG